MQWLLKQLPCGCDPSCCLPSDGHTVYKLGLSGQSCYSVCVSMCKSKHLSVNYVDYFCFTFINMAIEEIHETFCKYLWHMSVCEHH